MDTHTLLTYGYTVSTSYMLNVVIEERRRKINRCGLNVKLNRKKISRYFAVKTIDFFVACLI